MPSIDLIGLILLGVFALIAFVRRNSRSQTLLNQWATENKYKIIDSDCPIWGETPFRWVFSSQVVCHVTILDADGRQRSGWVKLGDWLLGLTIYEVEVIWEDV